MSAESYTSAKQGDAFAAADGSTWMFADRGDVNPWLQADEHGYHWRSRVEAHDAQLEPLVSIHLPSEADASDPDHLAFAAAVIRRATLPVLAHADSITLANLLRDRATTIREQLAARRRKIAAVAGVLTAVSDSGRTYDEVAEQILAAIDEGGES